MAKKVRAAEIRFSKAGVRPAIEITVPYGTRLAETVGLHEYLSKNIISELSPRGCLTCNSGVDIWIHEQFEDVINIDLDSMDVIR